MRVRLRSLAPPASLLLALAGPALAGTHWTVAPDGSGDFTDVASAVLAVEPGDVLLIQPGSYGDVVVAKPLSLIGDPAQPRPAFTRLRVAGAQRFDAFHLAVGDLEVEDAPGRSHVDRCRIGSAELSGELDVAFSRTTIRPPDAALGETALFVLGAPWAPGAARVRLVDCVVQGGRGLGYVDAGALVAGHGGTGIFAGYADLWIAGTSVAGGDGQPGSEEQGSGGTGIVVAACAVDLRGSAGDAIRPGAPSPGVSPLLGGLAIEAGATCAVTWSGLAVKGGTLGPVVPVADQPYLEITGGDGPGATRTLDLYASDALADAGFVALAKQPAFEPALAALYGAPLEIDVAALAGVLPLAPLGQDAPAQGALALPPDPALAGLAIHAQALVGGSGGLRLTNPAAAILSF